MVGHPNQNNNRRKASVHDVIGPTEQEEPRPRYASSKQNRCTHGCARHRHTVGHHGITRWKTEQAKKNLGRVKVATTLFIDHHTSGARKDNKGSTVDLGNP